MSKSKSHRLRAVAGHTCAGGGHKVYGVRSGYGSIKPPNGNRSILCAGGGSSFLKILYGRIKCIKRISAGRQPILQTAIAPVRPVRRRHFRSIKHCILRIPCLTPSPDGKTISGLERLHRGFSSYIRKGDGTIAGFLLTDFRLGAGQQEEGGAEEGSAGVGTDMWGMRVHGTIFWQPGGDVQPRPAEKTV